MTDLNPVELPPHKPFTLSGWLVSAMITTAVIGGIIGVLFMLFLGDRFWPQSDDPATPQRVAELNARIAQLEQKTETAAPQNIAELQNNVQQTAQQTAALQEKVEQIDQKTEDNTTNRILLGITQLKTAYDDDLPLQLGIDTLSSAVDAPDIRETLAQLKDVAAQGVPSKDSLLRAVNDLGKPTSEPSLEQANLTWQERAKIAAGKFVKVRSADQVAQKNTLHTIRQSLVVNDLATAAEMVRQLPQTAETEVLVKQIELRLRARTLMQNAVRQVTHLATNKNESLY